LARVKAGEPYTLRLNVPGGETLLPDLIRGDVLVKNEDIEDIILVRTGARWSTTSPSSSTTITWA
jgi:hypothetical protein